MPIMLMENTYYDQSGKIGSIPDDEGALSPMCTTGIIIAN